MRAPSVLQSGGVALTPPIDCHMISCDTALLHHFFEVAISEEAA